MLEIKVSEVMVEGRTRIDYGWLDSLERSIENFGVLQPIGITQGNKLIFGGRRLQACKNLGIDTIPARVFNIDADDPVTALRMERVENDQRLDMTPSEKVALAMKIEDAMAGRVGNPNFKKKTIPQNFAELEKPIVAKGESKEIAAEAVGMNKETYRQAKTVVNSGNQEVIAAMDNGELSIHAAYKEVKEPKQPDKPVEKHLDLKTLKITIHINPADDAKLLLKEGGKVYAVKLAQELLKAAGVKFDVNQ